MEIKTSYSIVINNVKNRSFIDSYIISLIKKIQLLVAMRAYKGFGPLVLLAHTRALGSLLKLSINTAMKQQKTLLI